MNKLATAKRFANLAVVNNLGISTATKQSSFSPSLSRDPSQGRMFYGDRAPVVVNRTEDSKTARLDLL
jgi:hypothetical protein